MQPKYLLLLALLACVFIELTFYYFFNGVQSKSNKTFGVCHLYTTLNRHTGIENQDIVQYGSIRPGRKYAVFTSSIYDSDSVSYAFDLPLTAMTWKRIGFDSIIIIAGDPQAQQHKRQPWIQFLMDTLIDKEHILVMVLKRVPASQATSISQVSRLFAASLLQYDKNDATIQNIYIVTTDADIWPIAKSFFVLPPGKDILHGDIGKFQIENMTVIQAPLSYIGMKIRTWHSVMTQSGLLLMPNTTGEIVKYFGGMFHDNVTHGGPGWGIDQVMISLRLHQWKIKNEDEQRIHVYQRHFGPDRIDRNNWPMVYNINRKVDAHILKRGHQQKQWKRLMILLTKMCPGYGSVKWCEQYAHQFNKLITSEEEDHSVTHL